MTQNSKTGAAFIAGGFGAVGDASVWIQIQSFDKFTLDTVLSGERWEILGLDQSDNANVIKLAYRRLARQYHSDVNSSASQKL
ncbi:MAG: DnaJ domain-containing protein [Nostoc sp.]|uniref:DnaJ domain-containing protein n=1 Tax=Nostoc sp. TaxID=1180 RepID=UPI002FFAC55F